MSLQVFDITSRFKRHEILIPQLSDFEIQPAGTMSNQEIINNPHISLYCLDIENKNAVFVQTPPEVDLSLAPFYYMTQFDKAARVILVPFADLFQLAEQVPLGNDQLIFVYSIGRCGSTLTSAAFNQAKHVTGLSEPGIFTQFVAMRAWDGSLDPDIRDLLKACTHLTCKHTAADNQPLKWAIKFRSYGIEIGDLLYDLFPGAKCLFLYRNAADWVDSMVRGFGGEEALTPEIVGLYWAFMKPVVRMTAQFPEDDKLTIAHMLGVHWLAPIDRYLQLTGLGIKMLPVRYEDLKTATVPVIEAIFAYCGVEAEDHSSMVNVLTRDSQAGSPLARELSQDKQFPNKDQVMKEIQALLSAQPVINQPDYVLPGTLVLSNETAASTG